MKTTAKQWNREAGVGEGKMDKPRALSRVEIEWYNKGWTAAVSAIFEEIEKIIGYDKREPRIDYDGLQALKAKYGGKK
jgi:hypothetical protein